MLFGIGVDILDRDRLERGLDAAFIERVYSPDEISEAMARPLPSTYFATRFAAKEAIYKAIGSCGADFRPRDIEILTGERGEPRAFLRGETEKELREHLKGRDCTLLISLSYEEKTAVAYAAAELQK